MKTRLSLLQRINAGDETAWTEVSTVYRPMIRKWLRGIGVSPNDAEDLTQDVMAVVVKEVSAFEHNGRIGAFRNWLRLITVNRSRQFFRDRNKQPAVVGGSGFLQIIDALVDPTSESSMAFNREHDLFVLRRLLQLVATEFEPTTMKAFQLYVVEGNDASTVAKMMNVSQQVAYLSKSRVLRRLRELAPELMEDLECSTI